MNAFDAWTAHVRSMMAALGFQALADPRWAITAWPFDDSHKGEPAVRFAPSVYVTVFNAGQLPSGEGTQTNRTNAWVYVLASAMTGNNDVVRDAPHTMTAFESVQNTLFTGMDTAADTIGLPSLGSIEGTLKTVGYVAVGVLAYLIFRQPRYRADES